jgi:hypothetical protein
LCIHVFKNVVFGTKKSLSFSWYLSILLVSESWLDCKYHCVLSDEAVADSLVNESWLDCKYHCVQSDEAVADSLKWVDGSAASGSGVFGMWADQFPNLQLNMLDCGIMQTGLWCTLSAYNDMLYCYSALDINFTVGMQ